MKKMAFSMRNVGEFVWQYASAFAILLLLIFFTSVNPNFLGSFNIKNLLTDASTLLILSTGVTFPILLGSTDLSTGHMASLFCVITGSYIGVVGNTIFFYALLTGALAGMINGYLHVTFKIPAFVVTLCTGNIFAVLAKVLAGGGAEPIPVDKWDIIEWVNLKPLGVPILFWIALLVMAFFYFLQRWTVVGESVMAIGANEIAARTMGVNIEKFKILAFMFSGFCGALCGALLSLKLKSNSPTAGSGLTMIAIASVALGGTTLFGGSGSVLKSFSGVLVVIIIENGLSLFGVDAFWSDIVFGTLLILAIIMQREKSTLYSIVK